MDDKYTKLVETLQKESQDLWFEYNLEVNRILQENTNLQERVDKLQQENKSQKEIINKAVEYIAICLRDSEENEDYPINKNDLEKILQILED